MKYKITDTSIIKLSETYGTIQNIGNSKIEISDSASFINVFLLNPLNSVSFNKPLYVRKRAEKLQIAIFNVVTFISGGSSASSSSSETTNDVSGYINSIFSGGDANYNDSDVAGYIDDIFNGGDDNYSDDDFSGYLDDIFGG